MQSFLAWYIRPQNVNIALILNILSNVGTGCILIESLAFSNVNSEEKGSLFIENPQ